MQVQFLKHHTFQGSTWHEGALGNIIGEKAKEWEALGILRIVDTTAAMKPPAEPEEIEEEKTTAPEPVRNNTVKEASKRQKKSLRKRPKE